MENNVESNDENNFSESFYELIALYEATCAKMNMKSNNGSEDKHNLEESMESCKITSTKVTEENIDSKEECSYARSTESSTDTSSTEDSAESQELVYESMQLVEVTSARNGAKIIFATDDCYGVAENLLKDDEPVCNEHMIFDNKITNHVDGWETRKTRSKTRHNFVIIELADGSDIHSICIDTACFTDSYNAQFSVQGGVMSKFLMEKTYLQSRKNKLGESSTMKEYMYMHNQTENWPRLILLHELNPGYPSIRKRFFKVLPHHLVTHLRLNIFPNGGIARLRAYGKVTPIITGMNKEINLISSLYNSRCLSFSETYIGHPNNIIQPNKATSGIDGWIGETEKKLHHKNETSNPILHEYTWAIFKLGCSGTITYIVIDTSFFIGNDPYMVQVQGFSDFSNTWKNIIPYTHIKPGTEQMINVEEDRRFNVTNVKIIIKPDGGISRFRVFGIPFAKWK